MERKLNPSAGAASRARLPSPSPSPPPPMPPVGHGGHPRRPQPPRAAAAARFPSPSPALPPGSLRVASLPPAPSGFSPPPLQPPPPPFHVVSVTLPAPRYASGPGGSVSPPRTWRGPGSAARYPGSAGPAGSTEGRGGGHTHTRGTAGEGEGRGEGCQPKLPAREFPGCAGEELEEVNLPHSPLPSCFLSPHPPAPPGIRGIQRSA